MDLLFVLTWWFLQILTGINVIAIIGWIVVTLFIFYRERRHADISSQGYFELLAEESDLTAKSFGDVTGQCLLLLFVALPLKATMLLTPLLINIIAFLLGNFILRKLARQARQASEELAINS